MRSSPGSTSVPGHAAIGVDDDLASRQAGIAHGAADDEFAGGVDVISGTGVQPLVGQHGLDDHLHYRLVQLLLGDLGAVLRGKNDGVDGDWLVVLVTECDLRLGVGAQPR